MYLNQKLLYSFPSEKSDNITVPRGGIFVWNYHWFSLHKYYLTLDTLAECSEDPTTFLFWN